MAEPKSDLNESAVLIGLAGIATSLAGFTGVSSSSAAAAKSTGRIRENLASHGDVDRVVNHPVAWLFSALIVVQVANALLWHQFTPLLAALMMNLAGAAMQFARLIRSAFQA